MSLSRYLSTLASWKGYNEADDTDDIIINLYNSQRVESYKMYLTDPWCHATVSAAAYKSGNFPGIVPNTAYCPNGVDWFKEKGLWKSYNARPEVGWIVYYDWSGYRTRVAQHVGVVIGVNGSTIVVREGNYNDMLKDRNIEIGSKFILGYGAPKWPAEETVKESSSAVNTATNSSVKIESGAETYTVKAGDNMYRISKAAGIAEEDLCKWNGITNPSLINVGQVIRLTKPEGEVKVEEPIKVTAKYDEWVARVQAELNKQFRAGLVVDGEAGPLTLGACVSIGYGAKGNLTKLVQERLGGLTIDGQFGPATYNAIKGYQESHNIPVTGRVDTATWRCFFGI